MFSTITYVRRRQRLADLMPDSLLLFIGNENSPFNYPSNEYRFRQDSTFLYLFGLDTPGLAAIIDTASGLSTLFADDVTMDDIVWTGPMPSADDRAKLAGIDRALPSKSLDDVVARALASGRKVHFVPPYRGETIVRLADLLGLKSAQVVQNASESLIRALVSLRIVKEQCEIDEMERHMAFGYNMHTAAMRLAHEGVSETDIMARVDYEALRGGGVVSFPIICTVNGETLHNHGYIHDLTNGKLLLVDAGCESPNHYATDHTRTTPVGGRFSNRQREIYEIVLAANDAVAKNAAPGVFYRDMHQLACRTIIEGLKAVGIMTGDTDEALQAGAAGLFMPHGIGHNLGLDCHDMENYGENLVGYDEETGPRSSQLGLGSLRMAKRLVAGNVVTDEPGIYFIPELIDRWKAAGHCADFINFRRLESYKDFGGIRIEDDLLITPDGCRIMGEKRIPATPAEVEAEALKGRTEDRDILTQ
ncbi:MAG: aminopeptidase P family protein [Bacteroidales bacterium]|nr:aminopeptidase P family protein [Bacteroidales bacterium]